MRVLAPVILLFCLHAFLWGQATPHSANAEAIARADERIAKAIAKDSIESPGQVVVVYFTPKDRKPASGHPERVRRIVQSTAQFYEQELARHGFRDRRMNFLRTADDKIAIIDVVGEDLDGNYGKSDGQRIRNEIVTVLRTAKIDPETSVLLIFCNLMDYDARQSTISHHSPYYGGGTYLTGTAWQCDSQILDPLRLKDPTLIQDGEYGKITIGKHNSIFIGGVIHELGHALSLPHCKERADEADRGTALMGSGNRTYKQELRGEGPGTFLTQAHAMRLAAHPVLSAKVPTSLRDRPKILSDELRVDVAADNTIGIRGRFNASVPIHGVIAYFDPAGRSNYDATTATAIPGADGSFTVRSGRLRPNLPGQLRLVTCHVNGATTQRSMSYRIDGSGRPDLSGIRLELELSPMIQALRRGDLEKASDELIRLSGSDVQLKQIGTRVLQRFRVNQGVTAASIDPEEIPVKIESLKLSRMKPSSANVGWIRPTYDRVPDKTVLLSLDGDYYASGIYAHAPARHVYKIGGKWKKLTGKCGLQWSHGGKVDFQILGDGRELWSKRGVTEGSAADYAIGLTGVQQLTLIVTDGGNGATADWGVWIEPTLSR